MADRKDQILGTLDELKKVSGSLTPDQQSLYDEYVSLKSANPMQDLQKQYNMPLDKGAITSEVAPKYNALTDQYNQTKTNIQKNTDANAQILWGDYYQRLKGQQRNNIRKSALSGVQMANDILLNMQSQNTVAGMYGNSEKAQKDVDMAIANANFQKEQEVSQTYNQRNMFLQDKLQQNDYNDWSRKMQEFNTLSQLAQLGLVDASALEEFRMKNLMNPDEQDVLNLNALTEELESAKGNKKKPKTPYKASTKEMQQAYDLGKKLPNGVEDIYQWMLKQGDKLNPITRAKKSIGL